MASSFSEGHLDPSPFAPLCGCSKRGHAEAIIGGAAIKRRILTDIETLGLTKELKIKWGKNKKKGECHPGDFLYNSLIRNYPGKEEEVQKRAEWAKDFYNTIFNGMGIFLANIQSLLHLPLIVWKGTVAEKVLCLNPKTPEEHDKAEKFLETEQKVREIIKTRLIDPTWADKDELLLVETPGPGNRDAFIGAVEAFKAISQK